jgi:hypothetical protein
MGYTFFRNFHRVLHFLFFHVIDVIYQHIEINYVIKRIDRMLHRFAISFSW